MPATVEPSPFFAPKTPVKLQNTPGGTQHHVKHQVQELKSGYLGTIANLMNAIVGSGIVGIPFAIRQAGFLAGLFLIVLAALITEKSLRLLIATAKHVHVPSYERAAEAAFGKFGFQFVCANMFVMAYGAQVSYLMVVKDSFSTLLLGEHATLASQRAVLLLVSLLIMVPLSAQRDMADLAKTSRLSVLIDVVLVGLVLYSAPILQSLEILRQDHDDASSLASILWHDTIRPDTIFVGLGVLSFAYVCQHSAFIIAGSLEKPTLQRWSVVTAMTLVLCCLLEMTMGVSGYLAFGRQTQGNIINNLDPTLWSANLARGLLGTTMLFVYPLESFVARHVCVVLFFSGRRAHDGDDSSILNRRDRRIGLTVVLYILAVIPAAIFEVS
jgi:sodium-coupled neutral amino acid transporter 11